MQDRKHLAVPPAQTLYPSEPEFADPAEYIRSIASLGDKYGILKIVPPDSWEPPFCLDPRDFTMVTRTQELNRMGLFTRATITLHKHLRQFHIQYTGKKIKVQPEGKYQMNFYLLAHFVSIFGGYETVCKKNLWPRISEALNGLASPKELKALYTTIELPYIEFKEVIKRTPKFSRLLTRVIEREQESESEPNSLEGRSETDCALCKLSNGNISCSPCKAFYHQRCLGSFAPTKSTRKWWCPICLCKPPRYTYSPGEEQTLAEFQQKSNKFKEHYIGKYMSPNPTPEDIEAEFWSLVSNTKRSLEVEYGADLMSEKLGLGFPRANDTKKDKYAQHPWNLNNMGSLPANLFRHLRNPISGVTSPWGYAGMLFSAFCWHSEDHFSYSLNYHHNGATKTWYGIPSSHADRFEEVSRCLVPEEFAANADVLSGRATLLSPEFLVDNGVEVFSIHQNPGEFVLTFPNAYHAGFNHGYNFNEAVNYSPLEWLPKGEDSLAYYREMKHEPAFSQEELLYRIFIHEEDLKTRQTAAIYLKHHLMEEKMLRRIIKESKRASRCSISLPSLRKVEQDIDSDGYHCKRCKHLPYFSRFKNLDSVYYCPRCFVDPDLGVPVAEMRKFVYEVTREFNDKRLEELLHEINQFLE